METQLNTKFEQLKQKINAKIQALQNQVDTHSLNGFAETELSLWKKIQLADSLDSLNNLLKEIPKADLPLENIKYLLKYAEVKKAFY